MVTHIDLFSGIGGFALAVDSVWPNSEHIFCDNDLFCQQILKKHWPNAKIYGDIKTFTNTKLKRLERSEQEKTERHSGQFGGKFSYKKPFLLTGGFPCQPFSQAGQRKGTSDDRYLWPEMFRVIQEYRPKWVIAENVRGLITWNEGMVLEQVCSDLENEGYEVQPFIIPACAINAPHRRDRIWIVANSNSNFNRFEKQKSMEQTEKVSPVYWKKHDSTRQLGRTNRDTYKESFIENSLSERSDWGLENNRQILELQSSKIKNERPSWEKNWIEIATEFCSVDDGLSVELDEFKLSKSKHRAEQIKAYGNAIVPQVAIEILKSIKYAEDSINYWHNRPDR